ncbi:hypothetical protein BC829DRAFT_58579 [Chytridium lagenaria]|nr:hypothetical protein BC829DRAFT_58579 [Chytridium lagenaria]
MTAVLIHMRNSTFANAPGRRHCCCCCRRRLCHGHWRASEWKQRSLSPHSSVEGSRKTKPGRKPVDPTIQKVKRKNQNREAQRKFRERKEQYIKELEAKIKSIEEIVRESASDRERLTNVIMQLQSENERLRALHDAKGNHTSFNFQVQPSPATFKQPLRSPAYSASPPRDVNDRGASVLSSPSAAQVQEDGNRHQPTISTPPPKTTP